MDDINISAESCNGGKIDPTQTVSLETKDLKTFIQTHNDCNPVTENAHPEVLNDVVVKALEKIKNYFLNSEIEEQKLAEFMLKILTLNAEDMDYKDFKFNSGILDKLVNQITETQETKNDTDGFSEFLESLFGIDAAKTINEKLSTDNIDEIVEKLLGEDTKKMICDRLESNNLDDLLNKLIEEKLAIDGDPQAKHPNFNDFIAKILGEETKEFIRKQLEIISNENDENKNVLKVQEIE